MFSIQRARTNTRNIYTNFCMCQCECTCLRLCVLIFARCRMTIYTQGSLRNAPVPFKSTTPPPHTSATCCLTPMLLLCLIVVILPPPQFCSSEQTNQRSKRERASGPRVSQAERSPPALPVSEWHISTAFLLLLLFAAPRRVAPSCVCLLSPKSFESFKGWKCINFHCTWKFVQIVWARRKLWTL